MSGRDTIDDLAGRAGRWIALEELLFETLGAWARSVTEPAVKRLLATWCHRHAWHGELWRARLPFIPARTDGPDHTADVAAWIAPLQRVLTDPDLATTTTAKLAIVADPVLAALQSALHWTSASTAPPRGSSSSSAPTSPPNAAPSTPPPRRLCKRSRALRADSLTQTRNWRPDLET
jgi:hypothetical protein